MLKLLIIQLNLQSILGEPKSGEPFPPAREVIPVGSKERPIVSTTVPVTILGKYFLKGFIKQPNTAQNNPPINVAPNNAGKPKFLAITIFVGKNQN